MFWLQVSSSGSSPNSAFNVVRPWAIHLAFPNVHIFPSAFLNVRIFPSFTCRSSLCLSSYRKDTKFICNKQIYGVLFVTWHWNLWDQITNEQTHKALEKWNYIYKYILISVALYKQKAVFLLFYAAARSVTGRNDSLDINDITELLQEVGVQVIVLAGQSVEIH